MSAYIVSDKAFNVLYSALLQRKQKGQGPIGGRTREWDIEKTIISWRKANYKSVGERYSHSTHAPAWKPELLQEYQLASDILLFSILSNLKYQCSEASDSEAYEQMEWIEGRLGSAIAMDHRDFTWGLDD